MCRDCPLGYVAPVSAIEACQVCSSRSLPNDDQLACICSPGAYQTGESRVEAAGKVYAVASCSDCPVGSNCSKMGMKKGALQALPSFWTRIGSNNDAFIPCVNQACAGGTDICKEGHKGNMCTVCSKGYGRDGQYACTRCDFGAPAMVARVAIAVVALFCLFYYGVYTIRSTRDRSKKGITSMTVKIFISTAQVNAVLANYHCNWSSTARLLLWRQGEVSNVWGGVASSGCILKSFFGEGHNSDFFLGNIVVTTFPFAYAIIVLVFLSFLNLSCRGRAPRRMLRARSNQHLAAVSKRILILDTRRNFVECSTMVQVVLFLVYTTVTERLLWTFHCTNLGTSGDDQYLTLDMSIKCYSAEHMAWIWVFTIPALFAFVLGLPVVNYVFTVGRVAALKTNRRRLEKKKIKLRHLVDKASTREGVHKDARLLSMEKRVCSRVRKRGALHIHVLQLHDCMAGTDFALYAPKP